MRRHFPHTTPLFPATKAIPIALFLVLVLAAVAVAQADEQAGDDWETYSSAAFGFELDYPASWEVRMVDDEAGEGIQIGPGDPPNIIGEGMRLEPASFGVGSLSMLDDEVSTAEEAWNRLAPEHPVGSEGVEAVTVGDLDGYRSAPTITRGIKRSTYVVYTANGPLLLGMIARQEHQNAEENWRILLRMMESVEFGR